MKKHNFNAGPAELPKVVLENTAKAILDYNGSGMSIACISHRSKDFEAVVNEAVALAKEILNVPEGYSVLFLQGGASTQFLMLAYNLLEKKACYFNTGYWATKAMKEAKAFGEVIEIAAPKEANFSFIPKNVEFPTDVDYIHVTTNNTIYGTETFEDFDVKVPLIADASSDIMSRPMDVSKYAMIYAGAQKNIGPSGVAFVIIKNDILGKVSRKIPAMLDYKIHIENGSMYNTPNCLGIYMIKETFQWVKAQGGLEAINKVNKQKAALLYGEIYRNPLFKGSCAVEDRSIMNVCWVMKEEHKALEEEFLKFAVSKGMVGIKGHRAVGGFRASIYNAVPLESVQALVDCMKEFASSR